MLSNNNAIKSTSLQKVSTPAHRADLLDSRQCQEPGGRIRPTAVGMRCGRVEGGGGVELGLRSQPAACCKCACARVPQLAVPSNDNGCASCDACSSLSHFSRDGPHLVDSVTTAGLLEPNLHDIVERLDVRRKREYLRFRPLLLHSPQARSQPSPQWPLHVT